MKGKKNSTTKKRHSASTGKKKTTPAAKTSSSKPTKSLEILDLILFFIAVFLLVALLGFDPGEGPGSDTVGRASGLVGQIGHAVAYWVMLLTFGKWGSLAIPLVTFLALIGRWSKGMFKPTRWIVGGLFSGFFIGFGVSVLRLWTDVDQDYQYSGWLPQYAVQVINQYVGLYGTVLLTVTLLLLLTVILFDLRPTTIFTFFFVSIPVHIFRFFRQLITVIRTESPPKVRRKPTIDVFEPIEADDPVPEDNHDEPEPIDEFSDEEYEFDPNPLEESPLIIVEPSISTHNRTDVEQITDIPISQPVSNIKSEPQVAATRSLPILSLLDNPPKDQSFVDPAELEENARRLESKLASMKIIARVIRANPGPVITRYDLKPAADVKIARIANLADDIAMTLRSQGVRILAPIPGEAAVGIEIPNRNPQTVYIREIVASEQFQNATDPLMIALGKDANGEVFCVDLAKMPHLLIAGATGSGKSVCINAILASLLYRTDPKDVRIALIDPKKVELSLYARLEHQHLCAPPGLGEVVVTQPENAVKMLRSIHIEMEHRYGMLQETGVRGIDEYNKWVDKVHERDEQTHKFVNEEGTSKLPERMPYIVVVIDELADLMMTVRREFEDLVVRLAQMARAVGIHLIIATQRPSVDVVTGLIKANFPSRIAFKVAQKVDSRTIIDAMGADALLGRGDMLFIGPGTMHIKRLHGALITTGEVENIVEFVRSQPPCESSFELPDPETLVVNINAPVGSVDSAGYSTDDLFLKAAQTVVNTDQGSVSLLQRRLRVGYARAARLIDELEQAGVVGAFDGSKARQVLMDPEELRERFGVE